jgi:hypothetical protein
MGLVGHVIGYARTQRHCRIGWLSSRPQLFQIDPHRWRVSSNVTSWHKADIQRDLIHVSFRE